MCEQSTKDIRKDAPASHAKSKSRDKGKAIYLRSKEQLKIEDFIDRIFPDQP